MAAEPTPAELAKQIEATRARLLANIDEIADRGNPMNIAQGKLAKWKTAASVFAGDFDLDGKLGKLKSLRELFDK